MSYPMHTLGTDSREYEVLYHAALESAPLGGMSCEIGVREGGASELMMIANATRNRLRVHVAIDPWGSMPYYVNGTLSGYAYTDDMRRRACAGLYRIAEESQLDLLVFPCRDVDFFKRYADGVPFYRGGEETVITGYSVVHIDGPHSLPNIHEECDFFLSRILPGGFIVFDDLYLYDHSTVEAKVLGAGFERVDAPLNPARPNPCKASYRRR